MPRLIIAICLVTCIAATAQTSPVRIDLASDNGMVQLAPLDAETARRFEKNFRSPADERLKPVALKLTNGSGKAVIAASVLWTFSAPDHREMHATIDSILPEGLTGSRSYGSATSGQKSWSYLSVKDGAVLRAGEVMVIIPPGGFIRENSAGGTADDNPSFLAAADLTVLLDSVVLEDGTVLGPDRGDIAASFATQVPAIAAVAGAVRNAGQAGQDPIAALQQVARARAARREDFAAAMLQREIAHALLRSPKWRQQLEQLEAWRPPNFHR